MRREPPAQERHFRTQEIACDLVVVGGGLAGTCCALTAARAGIKVTLIQDRPVLGGNASSEVRMWVVGATSHMGNNNRWAREGGVLDEILVENLYRNPEGNPVLFDTILLDKVVEQPNITLLLDTAVVAATKACADTIGQVQAFCSQNSTVYRVRAPLFCDASGDGVLGFLAGAAYRVGAEAREEFGEGLAPDAAYGELLGHTIYYYAKDAGKPVRYIAPSFALADITRIPRYQQFTDKAHGSSLWWIEYGGRLDTVHDSEAIKWELWRIIYGVWDHIKNSGRFPEAETLTLEWAGLIPGKRESRRFEGDYILCQSDIVEQRRHEDSVSCGGWAMDIHPADGIYSDRSPCNQWHARGVYPIPYRCLYSRDVANLFLAGRIISASHVAFSSTRVQATCAHTAQAAGMAAALCIRHGCRPRDLGAPGHMQELQRELLRTGQYIPGLRLEDPADLACRATASASSRLHLAQLPPDGPRLDLSESVAQMLPAGPGPAPRVSFPVDVAAPTTLRLELRTSNRPDNYTPDVILAKREVALGPGSGQVVTADFGVVLDTPRYLFYCVMRNERAALRTSEQRITGILSVANRQNPAVSNYGAQVAPAGLGVESFEFWCPERRPGGRNLAVTVNPPLDLFGPENVANGLARPTCGPNAWVASPDDPVPSLTLSWDKPLTLGRIELAFDTDLDHPLETVFMGHPERAVPFCVRRYRICDGAGHVIAEQTDNHQTRNRLEFDPPVTTDRLVIQVLESHGMAPAALFQVRCYGPVD